MNDFEKWWYEIGSGIGALPNHDHEEHAMRISKLAWEAANKQICKERDEARRMYCHVTAKDIYHLATSANCIHVANSKNWDCFKKVKYL